jgi:hypothetical protein
MRDQQARLGRRAPGGLSEAPLWVVAPLAVIAAVAIFFLSRPPDNIDPQALRDIRAGQQQTTSELEAINDRLAAERLDLKMLSDEFLAQTSRKKAINDSHAAEDQFIALEARLSALQSAMARILGDNAELAERLKLIQARVAQPPRSLRRAMASFLAKDSEESLRPQTLLQPNPTPAIPKPRQNVMRNWF